MAAGPKATDEKVHFHSVRLLCDFIADAVIAGTGAEVTVEEMAAPSEAAAVAEEPIAPNEELHENAEEMPR